MPPKKKTDSPAVTDIKRMGDVVIMPTAVFEDLMTRLLLAEPANSAEKRSWWKP